jgi:multidrug efflux pump subunit AcrA (membrane-fusion protein)
VSEKNMDDLLAQLKAEFEPQPQPRSKTNQPPTNTSPQTPASSGSMNKMLEELRKDLESGRGRGNITPPEASSATSPTVSAKDAALARQRLNALIDQDYQAQAQIREAKFAEIQRQAEARIAEEQRRQQELIELQQREELRDRRRKEALREEAKTWLLKLNPQSEEGKWFQEFSYSYENKLQAAIDYLEAMRETGL